MAVTDIGSMIELGDLTAEQKAYLRSIGGKNQARVTQLLDALDKKLAAEKKTARK